MNNNNIEIEDQTEVTEIGGHEKFMTCKLGEETYAISISNVKEIVRHMKETAIPKTPDYVLGVINLRGKVVPVISLRMLFGLSPDKINERTCIIVIQLSLGESNIKRIGLVVDEVLEVQEIASELIEPVEEMMSYSSHPMISGVAKLSDEVKIVLNIHNIFSGDELEAITGLG